jgi:hypothetical protein
VGISFKEPSGSLGLLSFLNTLNDINRQMRIMNLHKMYISGSRKDSIFRGSEQNYKNHCWKYCWKTLEIYQQLCSSAFSLICFFSSFLLQPKPRSVESYNPVALWIEIPWSVSYIIITRCTLLLIYCSSGGLLCGIPLV